MAKTSPASFSPFIAEGLRLRAEVEALQERRSKIPELLEIDAALQEKSKRLAEIDEELIKLGAGRYRDDDGRTATVVAGVAPTVSPDQYRLDSEEDESTARKIAGDLFPKLFERIVYHIPREGFASIANAVLTPARARDVIDLCRIPGTLGGGRRAHVRWK